MRIHAAVEELDGTLAVLKYGNAADDAVLIRLMNLVYNERADTLIVPSRTHLPDSGIRELVNWAAVVCADTGERFSAEGDGERPKLLVIREEVT
ncbi:hypothetical protein GCM10027167_71230 [Nocardia heshunensis]